MQTKEHSDSKASIILKNKDVSCFLEFIGETTIQSYVSQGAYISTPSLGLSPGVSSFFNNSYFLIQEFKYVLTEVMQ